MPRLGSDTTLGRKSGQISCLKKKEKRAFKSKRHVLVDGGDNGFNLKTSTCMSEITVN